MVPQSYTRKIILETLASKRLEQSEQLLAQFEELDTAGKYAEEIDSARDAIKRENIADLATAAQTFLKVAYELNTEEQILAQFEAIKTDPTNPCYAYQVYQYAETPELVAYCLADFLGDASAAMESYQ